MRPLDGGRADWEGSRGAGAGQGGAGPPPPIARAAGPARQCAPNTDTPK